MATYLTGPLELGTALDNTGADTGYVLQAQTTTVTTVAAGTASSSTIVLPANSQIVDIIIDGIVDAAAGAGTATAVACTVGTAAAGTQYLSSTDVIAGGRVALAFTTAQVAAMDDIGTNTNVVITVDPNGTISTTQGVYRMTVVYAQK